MFFIPVDLEKYTVQNDGRSSARTLASRTHAWGCARAMIGSTFVNSDPVNGRIKTTHASSEVVGRRLDVAVGALMLLSSTLSIDKRSKNINPRNDDL